MPAASGNTTAFQGLTDQAWAQVVTGTVAHRLNGRPGHFDHFLQRLIKGGFNPQDQHGQSCRHHILKALFLGGDVHLQPAANSVCMLRVA